MSSLTKKDRVSLCLFTFYDGRRCRTPRIGTHPHFCFYHAQKEAQARAAETLGEDLDYLFSGDYLSACDLSTALARLIPAVLCGDVKPKIARTVAYMFQTLLQSIHVSQHEYINAFSTNEWRNAIRNSVTSNHNYLFPPKPQPAQSEPLQPQPAPLAHPGIHPGRVGTAEAAPSATTHQPAPQPIPASPQTSSPTPTQAPPTPTPAPSSSPASQIPASTTCVTQPIPATQPAPSVAPTHSPACPEQARRVTPPQPRPSTPPFEPSREAHWLNPDPATRPRPDSKLL